MSGPFKNVAVVGLRKTSNEEYLGIVIVRTLLAAGFTVTAVSKIGQGVPLPEGATTIEADFGSVDKLAQALQGQDAVVCVSGTMFTADQKIIVDAAVQAKIQRFIASEYGLNTRKIDRAGKLGQALSPKIETVDYLMEMAAKHDWFTWSAIANNIFFDWAMKTGFLSLNIPNKTASIIDSGNEPFSTTNLPQIARGVLGVLKKPAETANKYLMIRSMTTTQNEILAALEAETGTKFAVTHITGADAERIGDEKVAAGNHYRGFWDHVYQYQWADGAGHALKDEDCANELLGLKDEDLRESVKAVLAAM